VGLFEEEIAVAVGFDDGTPAEDDVDEDDDATVGIADFVNNITAEVDLSVYSDINEMFCVIVDFDVEVDVKAIVEASVEAEVDFKVEVETEREMVEVATIKVDILEDADVEFDADVAGDNENLDEAVDANVGTKAEVDVNLSVEAVVLFDANVEDACVKFDIDTDVVAKEDLNKVDGGSVESRVEVDANEVEDVWDPLKVGDGKVDILVDVKFDDAIAVDEVNIDDRVDADVDSEVEYDVNVLVDVNIEEVTEINDDAGVEADIDVDEEAKGDL
jgi:hypothetical protein